MQTIFILFLIILVGIYITALFPETSRKARSAACKGTMFAHRGYHCAEKGIPENSMAAFRVAIDKGYGIELDVRLTGDEKVIVFHDSSLNRMCGLHNRPELMSASEIQKCRLLDTTERIPALSEALSLINGQVPVLIEFKTTGRSTTKLCECTWEILKTYRGSYLIQSFNPDVLHWFYHNAPHILRGQLSSRLAGNNAKTPWLLRFLAGCLLLNFWGKPDFISYKLSDLPTLNTTLLHKFFGIPFAVWTLRDQQALKEGIQKYEMQIFEKSGEFY